MGSQRLSECNLFEKWLLRLWTHTADIPGFESRQGVRLYTLQCCRQNFICVVIELNWDKKCFKNFFYKNTINIPTYCRN
jgi:hypothetical protein